MKHLKSYNESILYDNIRSNLEDICQELKDGGFGVYITYNSSVEQTSLIIAKLDITTFRDAGDFNYSPFKFADIEETVERIKEYMKSEGYEVITLSSDWPHNQETPKEIINSTFRMKFEKIEK